MQEFRNDGRQNPSHHLIFYSERAHLENNVGFKRRQVNFDILSPKIPVEALTVSRDASVLALALMDT